MGTLRRRQGRAIWSAIYHDSDGIRREVSTGCKDKTAARTVLAGLEGRTEKIKSGIISRAEAYTATWAATPLTQHVNDYIAALRGKGVTARAVAERGSYLRQVVAACRWARLCEMNRTQVERWLSGQVDAGKGARWHNHRVITVTAFANWLLREGRIAVNPFSQMTRRNEKADPRHQRRALSVPELAALFDAAQARPLERASRIAGAKVQLSAKTIDLLRWRGRTHAMLWCTLAYTGLRLGEARSITLAQVHLEGSLPYIELRAHDEKARRGAQIPLQADLAAELGNSSRNGARVSWDNGARLTT
jgi:integrase